jgi:undecaprenyl-diphosphatase
MTVVGDDAVARAGEHPVDHPDETGSLRTLLRRVGPPLLLAYAVLTLAWILLGRFLLGIDRLVENDERISAELAEGRTTRMDELTHWGSMLSDTTVKIVVTAILAAIAVAVWRRWHDASLLALSLILEASVFITVTWVIGRARPDVPRLEGSPVNSSFPSGHVAAAAAYGAVVIVVAWHTRRHWLRALSVLLVSAVVAAVAWARLYRGMHFLSDVIAGVALGVASILAVWWIMRRQGFDGSLVRPLDHDLDEHGSDRNRLRATEVGDRPLAEVHS